MDLTQRMTWASKKAEPKKPDPDPKGFPLDRRGTAGS